MGTAVAALARFVVGVGSDCVDVVFEGLDGAGGTVFYQEIN